MNLERKFLIVALLSVLLAIPVGNAIKTRTQQTQNVRQENATLKTLLDLDKKKLEEYNQQIQDQKKQIEDKDKQLQSKRDEEAKKAVAVQAPQAPVLASSAFRDDCEKYRGLVAQYSWNVAIAMAVMRAESTQNNIACNSNAANWADSHSTCKGSFGLFQIACFDGQVYDPAQNIAIAWRKYQASGWQPWGAFTNGSYLRYL